MPGSGKSTVGVLLAKALGYSFVDVDLIICKEAGKPLQKILDNEGLDFFLHLEGKIGAELDYDKTLHLNIFPSKVNNKSRPSLSRIFCNGFPASLHIIKSTSTKE